MGCSLALRIWLSSRALVAFKRFTVREREAEVSEQESEYDYDLFVIGAGSGGVRAARLGFRHKSEPIVKSKDPHGRTIYWVGPAGAGQDAGEGTDFHAVEQGAASVTPLKVDLTRHSAVPGIEEWLAR